MPPRLSAASEQFVETVIKVIYGTVRPNPDVTLQQFTVVLQALGGDGLTRSELAELVGCDESSISKAYAKLGPSGSCCLDERDGLIVADDHVIEAFNALN